MDEFEKFRELLKATYQFPALYPHKFIGAHTPEFVAAVIDLEQAFPALTKVSANLSASGKHLALTYEFSANEPEEIIILLRTTHRIVGLLYIL